MRTFLLALLVFTVSGDDETVVGFFGESVLLSCNCSERDLDFGFQWQKETKPNPMLVLKYSKTLNVNGSYKDRTFLAENSADCSVNLTNITADDHGRYRCSFSLYGLYQRFYVNLNVSARYTICQNESDNNPDVKSVECHVEGRYRETEIQWKLDGQLHINQSTTVDNRTHNGLYHFRSTFNISKHRTSEPKCHVKAKGLSTNITFSCDPVMAPISYPEEMRVRYLKFIPIVMVLGFSLVLWCRWRSSQRWTKIRGAETGDFYCPTRWTLSWQCESTFPLTKKKVSHEMWLYAHTETVDRQVTSCIHAIHGMSVCMKRTVKTDSHQWYEDESISLDIVRHTLITNKAQKNWTKNFLCQK